MELNQLHQYFGATERFADLPTEKIANALSKALTFETVSYEDVREMNPKTFQDLHKHLKEAFPLVHQVMDVTTINNCSLLYYWEGSDPRLKPALFMAHLDVVPVTPETEEDWQEPAFSGNIVDGMIWGRGAIDTKSLVIGELAAIEYIIEKGYTPKRGIYFAFGHDEETMGVDGTLAIAKLLKAEGVELEYVLDEGGGFKTGESFGAPDTLMAQIDIFEKGYADIAIVADSKGGHSSAPGKGTSLGRVAKALAAIEANPFSPSSNSIVENMLLSLSPYITEEPFQTLAKDGDPQKLAEYLYSIDRLAPLVHTTTAITMINGSPAPNVLPQKVKAIINFRLAPQDTCESVLKHCIETANDPELDIYMTKGLDPSKISKADSASYDAIKKAIHTFFPNTVVVSGLITGATDCRYFEDICDHCYRFRPYIDNMILKETAHATNERCSIEGLTHGVKVLIEIMLSTCF